MFKDGIGRFGLLIFAGGLLAIATASAQTPADPGKDELRQKIAAGAEACRKSLGSAPPDIALREVEDFCTCMGVQEAAMSEMAGADKEALRPQLQQMCVGIIRKNAQAPATPPSAAQPVAPPSPATAAAPGAAPATKILSWTLTANGDGAPVAYVRTVPDQMAIRSGNAPTPPIVEALIMYCRAKDSIGLRAILKPGVRESRIYINFAGDAFPLALDRQGLATQKNWAAVAKEWEDIQKGITEADRQRSDREPHIEIFYGKGYRIGGNVDLDGMPQARDRLRAQCAEAIARGVPVGSYRTSGIEGFGEDVVAVAPPASLAPGNSSLAPKPKAAPDCSAAFERTYNALRRKELDLAGQTGAVMQTQPRFFWNFCPIVQQEIAAAKQIIAAANACPSHRRAASIKAEATAKLAKRQRELARPKCM